MASVYTPEQITKFLDYIELPKKYHPSSNPVHDLDYLTQLHVHTISKIPYDNLSLHYSPTHKINIDPLHSYQKIVENARGRGGYCMENSLLFNHILRGLGFQVYTAGVRIRLRKDGVPDGDYIGWVHLVNIVTLPDSTRWMLDVGFGGDGATLPVPLIPGQILSNIGSQEIRLIRDHIPTQTHRTDATKLWIYQYRNFASQPWNSFYAFPETEFMEADFKVMNWYTGSSPTSFQTFTCILIKFLRREREDGKGQEVYGKRMLVNGTVKENLGGKTKVVRECRTEGERIEALEEWFGMRFTEEEREGIKGHVTELKGAHGEGLE
ncbi:arylamine N-acetyltransferase 1 [Aaosphaeria arxii CBS 175.79]|uniref:Arylamine N-acetyltransferase 1 n=1 Tax=Aaosphaeria arxii CBS 175.79 TaxID=1450172 RepID=A0A6A5XSL1_9PLEO|nr:arylamine N-acetyltransferase 1 [Aaosphaeria arxii CBS 175.79]KAF2015797.1 arylamine N-acetyltransferase 1 [Aaosphaeria arxii CBS 175.79]